MSCCLHVLSCMCSQLGSMWTAPVPYADSKLCPLSNVVNYVRCFVLKRDLTWNFLPCIVTYSELLLNRLTCKCTEAKFYISFQPFFAITSHFSTVYCHSAPPKCHSQWLQRMYLGCSQSPIPVTAECVLRLHSSVISSGCRLCI
jgi:hypothetical protein